MFEVITRTHGDHTLGGAFCCFAIAGLATSTIEAPALTVGAVIVAIGGVYATARYASTVTRKRLAVVSLGTWLVFLAVSSVHIVGPATVGAALPLADAVVVHTITAVTWAVLLVAVSTTTFLGFREYGQPAVAHSPEESVVDGEPSDYSTR